MTAADDPTCYPMVAALAVFAWVFLWCLMKELAR